ncbi:MAG: metal ABC transporter permease [Chthoniobacterales bacterium]|jgi:zinc transport system permease protein|nr:metal ABC transporter permease [Chthoniobacterales bacterium]
MIESILAPWHAAISALPFEWARFGFMRLALLAVLLVSPLLGALGTVVVANRMAFFSEAIGHAAFTGIALGVLLGLSDPLWPMIGFALLLALAIAWFRRRGGLSSDTAIGLVMAFTVSLGIVILSRGGDFARYTNFLVGDMLAVTSADIARLVLLAAVVFALFFLVFNRLLLATLSPAIARSRAKHAAAAELAFACLLAVVVTCALPWIGILVINALLILPAAAARNLAGNIAQFFGWSVVISLAAGVVGLLASFYASTATGATIVLAAMAVYLLTLLRRPAR